MPLQSQNYDANGFYIAWVNGSQVTNVVLAREEIANRLAREEGSASERRSNARQFLKNRVELEIGSDLCLAAQWDFDFADDGKPTGITHYAS